jgi:hypothetical protein
LISEVPAKAVEKPAKPVIAMSASVIFFMLSAPYSCCYLCCAA